MQRLWGEVFSRDWKEASWPQLSEWGWGREMRPYSEDSDFSLRRWQPQVGPEQG